MTQAADGRSLSHRHLKVGWWALFVYALLGLSLEMLHAFKAPLYLDVGNETRRLMWTLAHAHGTLLALVNVAYGLTVRATPKAARPFASRCLLAALVLVPVGFFGGGVVVHGGDPGLLVVMVPAGAVALAVGLAAVAYSLRAPPVDG